MIRTAPSSRIAPTIALIAALLASCSDADRSPPDPVAPPAAALPADHPPLGEAAAPATRLPPATVLATVGAETVTAGDVEAALAGMPNADRLGYATPAAVRELVEMLVDRRLMARAARADGLDRDPVMKEILAEPLAGMSADQVLAEVWLEGELAKRPAPAAGDVERYYREHPEEFTEPARVRVTRVTAVSEAAAASLRDQLAAGATLAALRADGAARSAEELWLQDVPKAPATTAAALALAPGEVSAVLPAADAWLVMRAEEVVAARQRSLDEVRAGITAGLESRRRQDALAELRQQLRRGVAVAVDDAAVSSFLAPPAPAG